LRNTALDGPADCEPGQLTMWCVPAATCFVLGPRAHESSRVGCTRASCARRPCGAGSFLRTSSPATRPIRIRNSIPPSHACWRVPYVPVRCSRCADACTPHMQASESRPSRGCRATSASRAPRRGRRMLRPSRTPRACCAPRRCQITLPSGLPAGSWLDRRRRASGLLQQPPSAACSAAADHRRPAVACRRRADGELVPLRPACPSQRCGVRARRVASSPPGTTAGGRSPRLLSCLHPTQCRFSKRGRPCRSQAAHCDHATVHMAAADVRAQGRGRMICCCWACSWPRACCRAGAGGACSPAVREVDGRAVRDIDGSNYEAGER
jgi:hypothetical protein